MSKSSRPETRGTLSGRTNTSRSLNRAGEDSDDRNGSKADIARRAEQVQKAAMRAPNIRNASLLALIVSCFLQLGGQLFALSVVVSTIAKAPPRSFAILEGEYRYDSSAFWDIVPMITGVLFLIAVVANWTSSRRWLLLAAFALFVLAGLLAGFFLEPEFATMVATGYRDIVDPVLQSRAAQWYALDWGVWVIGLAAGLLLLIAMLRPIAMREANHEGKAAQA
jgi:hypothetical protein